MRSFQSLESKLHVPAENMPVVAGIVAIFLVACAVMVLNVTNVLGGADLVIQKSDEEPVEQGSELDVREPEYGESSGLANSADTSGSDGNSHDGASQLMVVAVHVCGSVANPGVYSLQAGSRVDDAIKAAGGFAEGAATDAVNLARVLQDGEQIDVPTQEEVDAGTAVLPDESPNWGDGGLSGMGEHDSQLVNINTASSSQLQSLPGIGEATAAKVIESREREGPFNSKEDIMRVSGIGEKKYAAIADLITI